MAELNGKAMVAEKEERRALKSPIELRADDASATISGYAAVFNQETIIGSSMWGFREQIDSGAFDDAVKTDDVRALFNHDPNILLGRTESGTLRLKTDKKGLRYEVDLPDTAQAKDVRTLIQRGDVSGSSFGFIVEEDDWDEREVKKGKLPLRTILKASLFDVSPVTFPAYEATSVSARSKSKAEAVTEAEAARVAALEAAKPDDVKARESMRAALDTAKAWRT
jgi:HK97 family phage prohead protease